MFERFEDAEKQILQNKHTLLEGYVTEYLFEKQFPLALHRNYTSGWWCAEIENKRFFFVVSESFNDVDQKMIQILSKQFSVWRAYPTGNIWFFYSEESTLSLPQFVSRHHLYKRAKPHPAAELTRDLGRQMKCVNFFKSNNILRKIAIERNNAGRIDPIVFPSSISLLTPAYETCSSLEVTSTVF